MGARSRLDHVKPAIRMTEEAGNAEVAMIVEVVTVEVVTVEVVVATKK